MRDQRFVAVHRGGTLSLEHHRQLMRWSRVCAAHVLPLLEEPVDQRLLYALEVAEAWEHGKAATAEAMKASLGAHAAAREHTHPVSIAVARAVGQAVATAHMADHSLGGALYALKAIKHAGQSIAEEKTWQQQQLQALPPEMIDLVLDTLRQKEKSLVK
jgi:hypothetical protein